MSMSNTEKAIKDIRRNTRRKFSTEEKIRIVLDGLRGESSIAELCRHLQPASECLHILARGSSLLFRIASLANLIAGMQC